MYFSSSNFTQWLDGAVLFLKTLAKPAKDCRGAEWIVSPWLAKMTKLCQPKMSYNSLMKLHTNCSGCAVAHHVITLIQFHAMHHHGNLPQLY